jgi:hypothetical protein
VLNGSFSDGQCGVLFCFAVAQTFGFFLSSLCWVGLNQVFKHSCRRLGCSQACRLAADRPHARNLFAAVLVGLDRDTFWPLNLSYGVLLFIIAGASDEQAAALHCGVHEELRQSEAGAEAQQVLGGNKRHGGVV